MLLTKITQILSDLQKHLPETKISQLISYVVGKILILNLASVLSVFDVFGS